MIDAATNPHTELERIGQTGSSPHTSTIVQPVYALPKEQIKREDTDGIRLLEIAME